MIECGFLFRPVANTVRHSFRALRHIGHHVGRIIHHAAQHKVAAIFVCTVIGVGGIGFGGLPFGTPILGGIPPLSAGVGGTGGGPGAATNFAPSVESGPGGFAVSGISPVGSEFVPELTPAMLTLPPNLLSFPPEIIPVSPPGIPSTTSPSTPIPEPGTFWLLATALAGLWFIRNRISR